MGISLRRAQLYREIALDRHKRPIANGRKVVFIREQVLDSDGRVLRSRTRDFVARPRRRLAAR